MSNLFQVMIKGVIINRFNTYNIMWVTARQRCVTLKEFIFSYDTSNTITFFKFLFKVVRFLIIFPFMLVQFSRKTLCDTTPSGSIISIIGLAN